MSMKTAGRALLIFGMWGVLIMSAFVVCFEVFNLDQMKDQSNAGWIMVLIFAAFCAGGAVLTRRIARL